MAVWDLSRERYASKMRNLGTPLMITAEEFQAVARLLEKARRYGMSDSMIAEQTGAHYTLPSKIRMGTIKTMHRDTYEKVMRLRPQRPASSASDTRGKVPSGAYVGSTGTVRRHQALRADGFPGTLIGELLGVSCEAVSQTAKTTRATVLESTRVETARLYAELEGKRPEDFGVPSNVSSKCATFARRRGYAPRSCWDPGTIDDPDAQPEWTGYCGTAMGRAIHKRDDIPLCLPCKGAPSKISFSGERLRELRLARGLTQKELEEVAGLSRGHVHHWEADKYAPRPHVLTVVLSVLDATFEDVAGDEEA